MKSVPKKKIELRQYPPNPLPPHVKAEVERILSRAATRMWHEYVDLLELKRTRRLGPLEREYLGLKEKQIAGTLTEDEGARLGDFTSHRVKTAVSR